MARPRVHLVSAGVPVAPRPASSAARLAIPETPSATTWCSRTNMPTRPPARPGRNHISQRGACRIEAPAADLLDCIEQPGLVTGRDRRSQPDVLAQVEGGCVGPERPTQSATRHPEHLAQARQRVDPLGHGLPRPVDREAAIGVEHAGTIQDENRADVLWPDLVGQQQEPVIGAQSLDRHGCHLRHLIDQHPHRPRPRTGPNGPSGPSLSARTLSPWALPRSLCNTP